MSMYLKFRIGKDKRKLVPINGFELKDADSNNPQWLQGRQNEDGGRQVFVDLEDENGSPVNLTGASAVFKGVLPGGQYKIWDHKSSTIIDAQAGRFRYTFPKRAMAIAGSYKQAFFEIFREGTKLATLEFNFEVLADLVEENIIPSDYITPFEDLYGKLKEYLVKFNGDFEAAMAQWKKDVADLITELNADISGINLTITEIKSQLSALEDKIKADGLLTQADLDKALADINEQIKTGIDRLNQSYWVDDTIGPSGPFNTVFAPTVANTRSKINSDNFNLLFFTDAHWEQANPIGYGEASAYSLEHVNNAMQFEQNVDVMVAGGDNNHSLSMSLPVIKHQIRQFSIAWLLNGNHADKFMLLGNHDNGSMRTGTKWLNRPLTPDDVVSEEFFKESYMTDERLFGEIRDQDSLFFVKDYPDKKIRLVGINSIDNTVDLLDSKGNLKYLNQWTFAILQKQFDFLINQLNHTPADYHTMFIAHVPSDPDTIHYAERDETHNNYDVLIKLIDAFKNGTSIDASTTGDFAVTVRASFVEQGARHVIGFFNGHTHRELVRQFGTYTDVDLLNSIAVGNDRVIGNPNTEDAFTIISVDTDNQKVKLIGFGAATDREIDYE